MNDATLTTPAISRREKLALLCLVTVLALLWNWQFLMWGDLHSVLQRNDILPILAGYYRTPNLLVDGLRWWHGTWIQGGIYAYRPLSAYLYWIECWIGLHWGFVWSGWLGFALFVVNCMLCGALAWRLTTSRICAVIAAVIATRIRFFNAGQQDLWLIWFPGHQELLMHALLLGALLSFDIWQEHAETKYLGASWLLFAAGCMAKEHVYIFPLFALVIVLARRRLAQVKWQYGLAQCLLLLLSVLLLWLYRASIIAHPRNPHPIPVQFVRKSLLFMYTSAARYLITGQFSFPGLVLLLFILAGLAIKLRHYGFSSNEKFTWLAKPSVGLPVALLIVLIYFNLVRWPVMEAFWFLFDQPFSHAVPRDALDMWIYCYSIWLLWKYRKTESTAASWCFLFFSYLPVMTYIGWHYTLPGSFIRSVYWAYFLKLVWLDLGRPAPWRKLKLNPLLTQRFPALAPMSSLEI